MLKRTINLVIRKLGKDKYSLDDEISSTDLLNILVVKFIEMSRGLWLKLFLKSSDGLIFVGKRCSIKHSSHIKVGKTVQIGHTVGITPVDIFNWQWNAASISGSNGQSGQGIYPDVIALMASGRIDMRKMVTGRFNLEDIEEGMKITAGKVLISTAYPRLQK